MFEEGLPLGKTKTWIASERNGIERRRRKFIASGHYDYFSVTNFYSRLSFISTFPALHWVIIIELHPLQIFIHVSISNICREGLCKEVLALFINYLPSHKGFSRCIKCNVMLLILMPSLILIICRHMFNCFGVACTETPNWAEAQKPKTCQIATYHAKKLYMLANNL